MSLWAESIVMWTAVTLYAAGTVASVVATFFGPRIASRFALPLWAAGAIAHVIGVVGRWARLGHGPSLGFYEVVSSYALLAALGFAYLVWRDRRLSVLGVALMPVVFLLLAGAMLASREAVEVSPTLVSWWLVIHVVFANLSAGSLAVGCGSGVLLLLPERFISRFSAASTDHGRLEDLAYRMTAMGFVFLGVMVVSGMIWANQAWGRYWGWDPVETWSLIAWLGYALVLHLRVTMGWHGRRFAWAVAVAFPFGLFALLGVPAFYDSIHAAYLGL